MRLDFAPADVARLPVRLGERRGRDERLQWRRSWALPDRRFGSSCCPSRPLARTLTAPGRSPDQARADVSTTRGVACRLAFANRCNDEPYAGELRRRLTTPSKTERTGRAGGGEGGRPEGTTEPRSSDARAPRGHRDSSRRAGKRATRYVSRPADARLSTLAGPAEPAAGEGDGTRERFTPPSTPRRVKRLRANRGAFHHPGSECALSRAFTSRRCASCESDVRTAPLVRLSGEGRPDPHHSFEQRGSRRLFHHLHAPTHRSV